MPAKTTTQGIKQLSYANPLAAVFLRILAWEWFVAERPLTVKDVVSKQIQEARRELGLSPYADRKVSGGADDFIQKLRDQKLLSDKKTAPIPVEKRAWKEEWRLLYLPPHDLVRQLSAGIVYQVQSAPTQSQPYTELSLTIRNPAVPTIRAVVGPEATIGAACAGRRGVYFLRLADELYIGKTDEFETRLPQHQLKKKPVWAMFFSLEEDERTFTLDALGAAEGLLISFWNEVSRLKNGNRGSDRQPAFTYLQQAILFTQGVSAAFRWMICESQALGLSYVHNAPIPFKSFNNKEWPGCYLKGPA